MLSVEYTALFKRDVKRLERRSKNITNLHLIMKKIEYQHVLPTKVRDHALSGNWKNHRELHIKPDWLLIYKLLPKEKKVIFVRTGTHSDLF